MKKTIAFISIICVIFACKKTEKKNVTVNIPYYEKAYALYLKNSDSAFYYFNKMATSTKDSLYIAVAYNYMGTIQLDAGDNFGSQESYVTSLKFLRQDNGRDSSTISSDNNGLAYASLNLKNYAMMLDYSNTAIKFNENPALSLRLLNNNALAYQKLRNYSRAIEIYGQIMAKHKDDSVEYAKVISNLARTKWLKDSTYNAIPEVLTALAIKIKKNDLWGQNASYSHLADYYMQKRADSALFYADKMYRIAKKLESPDDQIEALQKLIKLSPPQRIKQYFEVYQKLDDSLQISRNASKNQFAVIRYEVEKSKADNLQLQKNNTEQKYQLFGISALVLIGTIGGIVWYRKRKERMETEAQNAIRENHLRTSKKVHDVVANGLYRVMAEIENQDTLDRGNVLDKIEGLYEKSRDISYEDVPSKGPDFHIKLASLLKSFVTDTIDIQVIGNKKDLWKTVDGMAKYEVEHIIQELMVNMAKHSQATEVSIQFEQKQQQLYIYYTDNGIGMPETSQFKNGLTNTGNRIKSINGTLNFETNVDKGLKIEISFPVS